MTDDSAQRDASLQAAIAAASESQAKNAKTVAGKDKGEDTGSALDSNDTNAAPDAVDAALDRKQGDNFAGRGSEAKPRSSHTDEESSDSSKNPGGPKSRDKSKSESGGFQELKDGIQDAKKLAAAKDGKKTSVDVSLARDLRDVVFYHRSSPRASPVFVFSNVNDNTVKEDYGTNLSSEQFKELITKSPEMVFGNVNRGCIANVYVGNSPLKGKLNPLCDVFSQFVDDIAFNRKKLKGNVKHAKFGALKFSAMGLGSTYRITAVPASKSGQEPAYRLRLYKSEASDWTLQSNRIAKNEFTNFMEIKNGSHSPSSQFFTCHSPSCMRHSMGNSKSAHITLTGLSSTFSDLITYFATSTESNQRHSTLFHPHDDYYHILPHYYDAAPTELVSDLLCAIKRRM